MSKNNSTLIFFQSKGRFYKMLKFLCVVTALMVSVSAVSQEANNSLFPELQRRRSEQVAPAVPTNNDGSVSPAQRANQPVPSLFDTETDEETRQREAEAIRTLFNESEDETDRLTETLQRGDGQTQTRKLSKAEENFFVFSPSEIQIVVPTISRFQFCTSHLTLSNNTPDVTLKTLGVVLKYADISVPYTYKGLNAGDSQSGTVALGGEACQVLLKVPGIDIKKCVATRLVERDGKKVEEEIPEAECRSKVKYLPR